MQTIRLILIGMAVLVITGCEKSGDGSASWADAESSSESELTTVYTSIDSDGTTNTVINSLNSELSSGTGGSSAAIR